MGKRKINYVLHTPSEKEFLAKSLLFEQIFMNLSIENVEKSVVSSLNYYDNRFPETFFDIICSLLYSSYKIHTKNPSLYIIFLKLFKVKVQESNKNPKKINIFEYFSQLLIKLNRQESNFLLEKLIEQQLIDPKVTKNSGSLYFAHNMSTNRILKKQNAPFWKQFDKNREELSKNNWKLHRKYVREGVNPNSIAKIIRNDEIENLQEISSQTNFDFSQKIEPSLYERCSFVNKENVTLIDYAAFFSSVKCFKYLLMNGAYVKNTGKYAVAGGNLEIIHLCEQNHSSFEDAYEAAIEYHRNDIFKYIYDTFKYPYEMLKELGNKCILYHNFEILSFLEENKMKIDKILIDESIQSSNLYIIIHFTEGIQILNYSQTSVVKRNNFEIFKYFFEKGLNINTCDIIFFLFDVYDNNLEYYINTWN